MRFYSMLSEPYFVELNGTKILKKNMKSISN